MVYLIIVCLVYHNSTCFRQNSVYYFHIKTETTRKSSSFGLLNQKLVQAFYPSDIFLLFVILFSLSLDGQKPDKQFIMQIVNLLGLNSKLDSLPNNLFGGQ